MSRSNVGSFVAIASYLNKRVTGHVVPNFRFVFASPGDPLVI
jgi:hypothetical protein